MDISPELFATLPTGVRLCYQTFGQPSDPAVILVAGAKASMLDWHEQTVAKFSPPEDRHYIVRFDHRDTGLSTEFPVPSQYTLGDMASDVEGLADHLELPSKGYHLVGASLGGPIATIVAIRRPQEVRSLTLVYTSPGVSAELPLNEKAGRINIGIQPMPTGAKSDRKMYIDHIMKVYDALATQQPSKEERDGAEQVMARVVDREMRSGNLYSKEPNHGSASFAGWPGVKALESVKCPTAVIQAALDQFFGVEHGEALAKGIDQSELVVWDDVGHELPRRIWDRLAGVLLKTWKRGDEKRLEA